MNREPEPIRRKVTLQHPTNATLQVVVWEPMATVLKGFGYWEVEEPTIPSDNAEWQESTTEGREGNE